MTKVQRSHTARTHQAAYSGHTRTTLGIQVYKCTLTGTHWAPAVDIIPLERERGTHAFYRPTYNLTLPPPAPTHSLCGPNSRQRLGAAFSRSRRSSCWGGTFQTFTGHSPGIYQAPSSCRPTRTRHSHVHAPATPSRPTTPIHLPTPAHTRPHPFAHRIYMYTSAGIRLVRSLYHPTRMLLRRRRRPSSKLLASRSPPLGSRIQGARFDHCEIRPVRFSCTTIRPPQ